MRRFVIQRAWPFLFLVLTYMFGGTKAIAAPVDSLLAEANRHYINLEYQEAETLYLAAIDEGYGFAELYYNLGNACYKLNQLARSILYYEKARELAPFDEDIRDNLLMANAMIVDEVEAIPDFFLKRWWRFLVDLMLPDAWAVISLFLFGSALFFVFMFMTVSRGRKFRKQYLVAGILLIMLAVLGYLSSISRKRSIAANRYAIIMDPSVTIKSSPDELGTNVFVLHEGTRVEILERLEEWREIKIANGSKGWIVESSIGEI